MPVDLGQGLPAATQVRALSGGVGQGQAQRESDDEAEDDGRGDEGHVLMLFALNERAEADH